MARRASSVQRWAIDSPARWMTPSRPLSAATGAGSSSRRHACASTSPSLALAASGSRVSTVTASPRASSAATIREPISPVAPVRVTCMSQLVFDDNLADQLERLYHKRDILRRRALVREAVGAQPGERILDVGCGPGFYVAEVLDEVGAEGSVVGIDVSPQMLAIAARRCAGRANVEFREG